jgi:hypothetical protein
VDGRSNNAHDSILNRGFCALPKDHGAWEFPYITIDRNNNALASIDDSLTWRLCKWKGVSGNSLKDQSYCLHFWRDSTYQDLEQAYTKIAKRFNYPIAAQVLMQV